MWRKINLIILFLLGVKAYAQSPLCSSSASSFGYEYVASVTINGKKYNGNTGYSGPGYYDYAYSNQAVPTITAGQSITISYTAQTKSNYMEYFKLWIDFNGNGNLNDAGELIHSYNVSWSGTKTVNATFTVPTSVYNGQVYMRFIMVYSSSPTLCGNYSYGNTFDFVTTITGATDPFSYSGYIYDSRGNGVENIPVKLYYKTKSATSYSYLSTHNTDSAGYYKLATSKDTVSYDFQMRIETLTIDSPSVSDADSFTNLIFNQNPIAEDYYRMDVNDNDKLTISDVYLTYMKMIGRPWRSGVPNYRLFTASQWSTITSSSSNLKTILPGVQTYTVNGLINKGSSDYYLIRTGHAN